MRLARFRRAAVLIPALLALAIAASAAEKTHVQITSYALNVELFPKTHKILAAARVGFTATEDISSASFELHNGLRARVKDAAGKPLESERGVEA